MSHIRRIADLEAGEMAYTTTASAWVTGGNMYVNGNHPLHEVGGGSFVVRLLRDAQNRLLVDLSCCQDENFPSLPTFGGPVMALKVDEALQHPGKDPSGRRIYDMRPGETAFIDPTEVWLYQGKRMWLNGHTKIASELSQKNRLQLQRLSNGAFVVDLSYCAGQNYADAPSADMPVFPIQVLRRIA